jgi:hypothetical protein
MERRGGGGDDVGRNSDRVVDGDDKHPLARLRCERRRVDHVDAEVIARAGERVADRVEILAAMGCEGCIRCRGTGGQSTRAG